MMDASTNTADTVSFTDGFFDANANQLPDAVDKYPDFLNDLFPGITPGARYYGQASAAGTNVSMNILVFEPGTPLPGLPAFDSSLGYPSISVFNDPSGPPAPSPITNFCTPLSLAATIFGASIDNPDTPADAEFRQDIHSGRQAIEAGIKTPLPTCPWQTTYCQKVLELIASDRRCRDCPVGQRLLRLSEENQVATAALKT